jgi:hypothetical protein
MLLLSFTIYSTYAYLCKFGCREWLERKVKLQ